MTKADPYFSFQLAVLVAIWRHPFSSKAIAKTIVLPILVAFIWTVVWVLHLVLKLFAHAGRKVRKHVFRRKYTRGGRRVGIWQEGTFEARLAVENGKKVWNMSDARAFHPGQGKMLTGMQAFLLSEARAAGIDSLTLEVQTWKTRLRKRYESFGFSIEKRKILFVKYRVKV